MSAQLELPNITDLSEGKRTAAVNFGGKRYVICPVTLQLITRYASIPVKSGKGNKIKWLGTFYDYETVMAYLAESVKRGSITAEQHTNLVTLLTSQLGFTPTTPNYDINNIAIEGFAGYRGSYLSGSVIMASASFRDVAAPKAKSDKPAAQPRYNVFEASQDKTGIHYESSSVKCTANSIPDMVKPWNDDDLDKAYTFLVTFDGHKQNAVVAESTTPMHHSKALGVPGAKGGTRVYVLKGTKAPKVKATEPPVEVKTEAAPAPKKRKATAATA